MQKRYVVFDDYILLSGAKQFLNSEKTAFKVRSRLLVDCVVNGTVVPGTYFSTVNDFSDQRTWLAHVQWRRQDLVWGAQNYTKLFGRT